MSEKRLNNTIFLMFLVTENYKKKHNLSSEEFLKLDDKYAILNYVSECPDIFDSMIWRRNGGGNRPICSRKLNRYCIMEQYLRLST